MAESFFDILDGVPVFEALEMDGLPTVDIPLGSSTSDSNSSSDQQENTSLSAGNIVKEAPDPVKASLKSKIQKKYLENGKTPLQVSFDPPPKYELTEEEKKKQELRKLRNRKSANTSREKRKQKEESLKKEVDTLESDHKKLKREVQQLLVLKEKMEKTFDNHLKRCQSVGERLEQQFSAEQLESIRGNIESTCGMNTAYQLSRRAAGSVTLNSQATGGENRMDAQQLFSRQTSGGFDASLFPQCIGGDVWRHVVNAAVFHREFRIRFMVC